MKMSRRERKAYNKGMREGYEEGYARGRSEGEVRGLVRGKTAAFLQLKKENRLKNDDRPVVIETDEMVCKEMPDKVAMCFNCNLKTDTCQEGLHCPKECEE